MSEWKWSLNQVYEKSPRILHPEKQKQREKVFDLDVIKENSAYLQSLSVDNSGWDPTNMAFLENQFQITNNNKREDTYNKMAEREMVAQIGRNPFLDNSTNNSDYVKDVVARDMFLKPVNTGTDKEQLTE